MKAIVEKHIGKESYKEMLDILNGNQEYREVAASYVKDFISQLEVQSMLEEEASTDELLETFLRFINCYKLSREYGFSKQWSKYYGLSKAFVRNEDYLLADCFENVAKECLDTAKKDLRLYCEVKKINMVYIF